MRILVTGGAGYIGSFMTRRLLELGYKVAVLDSLERGEEQRIDNRAAFLEGNLLDKEFLSQVFQKDKFDSIIHFAGFISMGESMEKPSLYFEDNSFGSMNLLESAAKNNVKHFIFSSTAGVYGNPTKLPIPEDYPKNPTNPYGTSKLIVEQMLTWYSSLYNISSASLRYFNACGASLNGDLGENHSPETHLIPNLLNSILQNKDFSLFGSDYPTKDGTCVRDYIHVLDLVEAHVLALNKLEKENGNYTYNVGTGSGFSNKEVTEMVEKVTGKKVSIRAEGRRPGDADVLIADATKIKEELGFSTKYSDLETIVKTAWEWHKRQLKS